jgi:hypothetical protein
LYAQWLDGYTVVFSWTDIPSENVLSWTEVKVPEPSKEWYEFTGWTLSWEVFAGNSIVVTWDVELVAHWKANTYKVVFHANEWTWEEVSQIVKYSEPITLTGDIYTRTGYTFSWWNTKADGSEISYESWSKVSWLTWENDAIVTLYAQWKANTYKVVFNANGWEWTSYEQEFVYDEPQTLTWNKFVYTWYVFTWWSLSEGNSDVVYLDNAEISSNLTWEQWAEVNLYAQWDKVYTVVFSWSDFPTYEVLSWAKVDVLKPNRTWYTFTGWTLSWEVFDGNSIVVTWDIELVAHWKVHKYTVKFDENGW